MAKLLLYSFPAFFLFCHASRAGMVQEGDKTAKISGKTAHYCWYQRDLNPAYFAAGFKLVRLSYEGIGSLRS